MKYSMGVASPHKSRILSTWRIQAQDMKTSLSCGLSVHVRLFYVIDFSLGGCHWKRKPGLRPDPIVCCYSPCHHKSDLSIHNPHYTRKIHPELHWLYFTLVVFNVVEVSFLYKVGPSMTSLKSQFYCMLSICTLSWDILCIMSTLSEHQVVDEEIGLTSILQVTLLQWFKVEIFSRFLMILCCESISLVNTSLIPFAKFGQCSKLR